MRARWCLQGAVGEEELVVVPIERFPFVIGREGDCDLTIASQETSRHHAKILRDAQGNPLVMDLGSTNGTYVNRIRIQAPRVLADNDVLHFGMAEFRFHEQAPDSLAQESDDTASNRTLTRSLARPDLELPLHFSPHERAFNGMLERWAIRALYQPIVTFPDRRPFALEVLGRGADPDLPESPESLFQIAATLGKEASLSRLFRDVGVRNWRGASWQPRLFVNAHPREMYQDALYQSLSDLLQAVPGVRLVLEVHEKAVTELGKMREMAHRLKDLGVQLTYDDFGAGQARLNELSEITPDYLKFDISLVRNIHQADKKRTMLETLVRMSHDLGILTLAEGVELQEEADCCHHLGFDLLQGFLIARPQPLEACGPVGPAG